MPKFIFTGDIRHPGRVVVDAPDVDTARESLANNDFSVYDETNKYLAFDDGGEDPEIEEE